MFYITFMGDIAQWLGHQNANPKTLGFIFNLLAGQGETERDCLSHHVNSCADLFVPDRPSCVYYGTHQICAHVFKDAICICPKRTRLTASGVVTQKYCIHKVKPEGLPKWRRGKKQQQKRHKHVCQNSK